MTLATARDAIDLGLSWAKWPVALASIAVLPAVLLFCFFVAASLLDAPLTKWVALGGAGYVLAWWLAFRRPSWGSLLSTFEHELTHAVFAWLTLHRVVGLRATWREGGHLRFVGEGNWIILVSPYVFPTLAVPVAVALVLGPSTWELPLAIALGATLGYHLTSTAREIHREQSDLQRVGLLASTLLIPTWSLVGLALALGVPLLGGDLATPWTRTWSTLSSLF